MEGTDSTKIPGLLDVTWQYMCAPFRVQLLFFLGSPHRLRAFDHVDRPRALLITYMLGVFPNSHTVQYVLWHTVDAEAYRPM